MAQLSLLPRGPLDDAVSPFAEERPARGNPAALLADLIDLRGGVALAEGLAGLDALEEPPPGADPEPLRRRTHAEIAALWRRLDGALDNAFRPRYRLPNAARLAHTLRQAHAFEAPNEAALRGATRVSWAPFNDFLEIHLKRARFGLRDLRAEVASVAPTLSLDAARLEHLDAALTAATAGETEALYARALGAGQRAYGVGLRAALAAEPTPDRAALEAWLAEDGWIPATFADAVRMVRAVVRHERRRLEALVEACCGPPPQR